MKTIGKIKKTCKFCGNDFVVYAGNHSVSRPYDFCSKRCATMYRYREHSSTPFPPIEDIKSFWNKEYEAIQRIVLKFIRNFTRVTYEEAINEAFLILAKALRFTQERLKIFARIKGGLITYFFNFYCFNTPYTPIEEIENIISDTKNEIRENDNAVDYSNFKIEILKCNHRCMQILRDWLQSMSKAEIKAKYNLKRETDVDTHIRNAVHHLKLIAKNGTVKQEKKLEKHFDDIKRDLEQGIKTDDLMKKYECSKTCLFDFMRKYNLHSANNNRFFLEEHLEEIKRDMASGMLMKDIRKKYNCGKSTLERFRKRYKLGYYAKAN